MLTLEKDLACCFSMFSFLFFLVACVTHVGPTVLIDSSCFFDLSHSLIPSYCLSFWNFFICIYSHLCGNAITNILFLSDGLGFLALCWHAFAFISWMAAVYQMHFLLTTHQSIRKNMHSTLHRNAECYPSCTYWSAWFAVIFSPAWILGTRLPCTCFTCKANFLWLCSWLLCVPECMILFFIIV